MTDVLRDDAGNPLSVEVVPVTAAADAEMPTARAVIVLYDTDVPGDELHPIGFPRGAAFEVKTPELAYQFHPHARIIRYADGTAYKHQSAKREANAAAKAAETGSDSAQTPEPSPTTPNVESLVTDESKPPVADENKKK